MSWQHCFKPGSKCRLYGTLLSHLFSPIKSRKTLTFHLWRAQASYIAGSSTTSSLLFALVGIRPDPLARACRRGAVAFSSASHLEDVTAAAVFDQLVKEVHARLLPAEPPSRVPGTRGLCGCPTPSFSPNGFSVHPRALPVFPSSWKLKWWFPNSSTPLSFIK